MATTGEMWAHSLRMLDTIRDMDLGSGKWPRHHMCLRTRCSLGSLSVWDLWINYALPSTFWLTKITIFFLAHSLAFLNLVDKINLADRLHGRHSIDVLNQKHHRQYLHQNFSWGNLFGFCQKVRNPFLLPSYPDKPDLIHADRALLGPGWTSHIPRRRRECPSRRSDNRQC